MTATRTPGVPVVEDGQLISTNPATGAEVGRFPVADEAAVRAAVARAQPAARWWAQLGFTGRRERLLRWRGALADRMEELAALINAEGGKPVAEAVVEIAVAVDHLNFAAKRARKVLGMRRVRSTIPVLEHSAWLEYQPYGVVGVIGPWNYPIHTPLGSISYALAAGNAVVFKPSEYTPTVGQWYVDLFNEIVPEQPVLQIIHGTGETGAALTGSAVDKLAFTGSTATGKKIMAACAATLKPVLLECGGKDAMVVAEDADVAAAADAATWGGLTNAGQACVAIERVYVADAVYDDFLAQLVRRAAKLTVSADPGADLGPITMPSQIDVIRRHIDDALAHGGRAVLGGPDAVAPPYVYPTILVDVPEGSAAVQEETFGPTLVVNRVASADEGVERANATRYGLGSAVFSRRHGMALARRIRSGMTSINAPLTFAGMPSLPFGGVGDSGIGRIHGDDGLREFGRAKAITRRRAPSLIAGSTFDRTDKQIRQMISAMKLLYGRRRR
jgi:succinate-semialdehyde dehydrogenase/glutarate-semialdehyde dehydrogenase